MEKPWPAIIVCPLTKSRLRREGDFLVTENGAVKYPIKDGLPVLLPEAAIAVESKKPHVMVAKNDSPT